MDSTSNDYGLTDAFISPKSHAPSFEFMLNAELKNNLYIDDSSRFNIYFYHFIFGFLSSIRETKSAEHYGIQKIFVRPLIMSKVVDGKTMHTRSGLKTFIFLETESGGTRKLFVKTFFFGDEFYQPVGIDQEEYTKFGKILDVYDIFVDEYVIKQVNSHYKNDARGSKPYELFVEKIYSSSKSRLVFPKLRGFSQTRIYEIKRALYSEYYLKIFRMLDTILYNNNDPKFTIETSLMAFLNEQYKSYAEKNIFSWVKSGQCGFVHGTLVHFKTSHNLETIVCGLEGNFKLEMHVKHLEENLQKVKNPNPILLNFYDNAFQINREVDQFQSIEHFSLIRPLNTLAEDGYLGLISFKSKDDLAPTYSLILDKKPIIRPVELLSKLLKIKDDTDKPLTEKQLETARNIMVQELEHILPKVNSYPVGHVTYTSRYMMGLFTRAIEIPDAAMKRLVNVKGTEKNEKALFLPDTISLLVKQGEQNIVISIKEYKMAETEMIKFDRDVEHQEFIKKFQTENVKLVGNNFDTLIFHLVIDWDHTKDDFEEIYEAKDFKKVYVFVTETYYSNIEQSFLAEEIKTMDMKETMKNYVIRGLSENSLTEKFYDIFNMHEKYIDSISNFKAFVDGLFHNELKIENLYRVPQSYSRKQFTIFIIEHLENAYENPVTINFATQLPFEDKEITCAYGLKMLIESHKKDSNLAPKFVNILYDLDATTEEQKIILLATDSHELSFFNDYFENDVKMKEVMMKRKRISSNSNAENNEGVSIYEMDIGETLFQIKDRILNYLKTFCGRSKRSDSCKLEGYQDIDSAAEIHISKLKNLAAMVMNAFLARDILSHLIKWDFKGLTHDSAFLGTSIASGFASSKLELYGIKAMQSGLTALGVTSRTAAVAVGRSVLLYYIISDLHENLKYLSNSTVAQVNVGSDATMLTVEGIDIAAETLELFGLVEGIAAVTAPIAAIVTSVLMIGVNVYQAVVKVNEINKEIKLTGTEHFVEGLHAFIHLDPEEHIRKLLEKKHENEAILHQANTFLTNQNYIKNYVVEASNGQSQIKNSFIDLRKKVLMHTSRASPNSELGKNLDIFCELRENYDEQDKGFFKKAWYAIKQLLGGFVENDKPVLAYKCIDSFGITNKQQKSSNATFFQVDDGIDTIYGFPSYPNIFNISNGNKTLHGGKSDDAFLVHDLDIIGLLDGKDGIDILDFSFSNSSTAIFTYQNENTLLVYNQRTTYNFEVKSIEEIHGRKNGQETLNVPCSVQKINLLGGIDKTTPDKIIFSNGSCDYNTTIILSGTTDITNQGLVGNFVYLIEHGSYSSIKICYGQNVSHQFIYAFTQFIDLINFSYIVNDGDDKLVIASSKTKLQLEIENPKTNILFHFADNVTLMIQPSGYPVAHMSTKLSVPSLIDKYGVVTRTINITLVAHSSLSKQTVTMNHGVYMLGNETSHEKFSILHNDPQHETQLVEGHGHHVITVNSNNKTSINDVTIVLNPNNSKHNLSIDITPFVSTLRSICQSGRLELKTFTDPIDGSTITIQLYLIHNATNSELSGRINLKNFGSSCLKRISILKNLPLEFISFPMESCPACMQLAPMPIVYNNKTDFIFLSQDMIEWKSNITIQKDIHLLMFYQINETLVLTNFEAKMYFDESNTISIVLHDFFKYSYIFATLTFKFMNKDIQMIENSVEELTKIPALEDLLQQVTRNKIYFMETFPENGNGVHELLTLADNLEYMEKKTFYLI